MLVGVSNTQDCLRVVLLPVKDEEVAPRLAETVPLQERGPTYCIELSCGRPHCSRIRHIPGTHARNSTAEPPRRVGLGIDSSDRPKGPADFSRSVAHASIGTTRGPNMSFSGQGAAVDGCRRTDPAYGWCGLSRGSRRTVRRPVLRLNVREGRHLVRSAPITLRRYRPRWGAQSGYGRARWARQNGATSPGHGTSRRTDVGTHRVFMFREFRR